MDTMEKLQKAKDQLRSAKETLIELSLSYAQGSSNWDAAQNLLEWARTIDSIEKRMEVVEGHSMPRTASSSPAQPSFSSQRLPLFYVEHERLIMRGPSRDGGFYEQRVLKSHFDLILRKLSQKSKNANEFSLQELQDRREMPLHEPGIIVRLFTDEGLLEKTQKGRYAFLDPDSFGAKAESLWFQLQSKNI